MSDKEPNWSHFWRSERHAFDEVMRLATQYFAARFCEMFPVSKTTSILDYGCGPGFLADEIIPRGAKFAGADINEFFIGQCRQHHPGNNFFCIQTSPAGNATILQQQIAEPLDYIVLLSISQYLSSPAELEEIVSVLKPHLKTSGCIVIADVIDEQTRSYRDALSLLIVAAKKGKLGGFLRFMRYVLRSEYARVAKSTRLQFISERFMFEMGNRQEMTCNKIAGLTFHPTRKNYVLRPVQQVVFDG